jgi:spore coat protein U-like protein
VTVYGRIFGAQPAWPGSYESSFQGIHTQLTAYTQAVPTCAGEVSPSVAFGFTASLNVVKDCAVTAQDLSFGTVGVLRTVKDAASQLSVTCTQGTAYTIGLQPQGGSLPVGQWRMVEGTDFILYGLYRDAARTRGWDMATANLASGTGTGVAQSIPVYGRLPVQKAPVAGAYTDTVVVTVTY